MANHIPPPSQARPTLVRLHVWAPFFNEVRRDPNVARWDRSFIYRRPRDGESMTMRTSDGELSTDLPDARAREAAVFTLLTKDHAFT